MAPAERDLPEAFDQIARSLITERTVDGVLHRICRLALHTVDGCDHAGSSLIRRGRITTPAATDAVAKQLDEAQEHARRGPCLEAIREERIVESSDLREEPRWPEFTAEAMRVGVRSSLSFQIPGDDDAHSALNLYSTKPFGFTEHSRIVGGIFAAHAAIAIAAAKQHERAFNLEQALATRDVIGQAKGVLMARTGVDADQAFTLLTHASQRLNRRLRDVAEDIARGREPSAPS